jgi:hypothetical protein
MYTSRYERYERALPIDRSSISEPAAGTFGTPRVAPAHRFFFSDTSPRLAQRSNLIIDHACIQSTTCATLLGDLLSFVSYTLRAAGSLTSDQYGSRWSWTSIASLRGTRPCTRTSVFFLVRDTAPNLLLS